MAEKAILRAMIAMARADDAFDDEERTHVREIYAEVTGSVLEPEDLNAEIEAREAGKYETVAYLRAEADNFPMTTKETIIKAAYRILLCDGQIAAEERKKLRDIADAIGMEEIHYKSVLEDVSG